MPRKVDVRSLNPVYGGDAGIDDSVRDTGICPLPDVRVDWDAVFPLPQESEAEPFFEEPVKRLRSDHRLPSRGIDGYSPALSVLMRKPHSRDAPPGRPDGDYIL